MGKVVPFEKPDRAYAWGNGVPSPGKIYDRCEGNFHIFAQPSGQCQCGSETWQTGKPWIAPAP